MSTIQQARPAMKWSQLVHPSSGAGHRLIMGILICAALCICVYLGWLGAGYYALSLADRPAHPLHTVLRPSGYLGIRYGLAALVIFLGIYLYPMRKRSKTMQRVGKTRHWLDVHVLLGLLVPIIVTYHSSFKLHGLAGVAYWIMIAIVVSGFAGRYLYSRIPRTVNAAEVTLRELQDEAAGLTSELYAQDVFSEKALNALLELPTPGEVAAMPLYSAVFAMLKVDIKRPFLVASLRRPVLTSGERWATMGGLLESSHAELESVIDAAGSKARLTSKILFLKRAGELFHLWHIVHRPFSYSFILLVIAHVAMVLLLGYF